VVTTDITERRNHALALAESERLKSLILDATSESIIFYDNDLRIVWANRAAGASVGSSGASLVGQYCYQVLYQRNVPCNGCPVMVARDEGRPVVAEIRSPEGNAWIRRGFPVFSETKEVTGVVAFGKDMTEREDAVRERDRLMSAIEQLAEMVIMTDPQGLIRYVNPAFTQVTGFSREEAVGQTPRFLKSGKQEADFYRDLWKTITQGRTWSGRFINRKKDGSLYYEDAVISPVFDAKGTLMNFVAVKRDVTKELTLEQQLNQAQKLESLGRLAGGVAHDFNNLLGAILMRADLALAKYQDQPLLRQEFQEIRDAVERSAELTRQLLTFSRQQHTSPQVINLNHCIGKILTMLRRLIGEDIQILWHAGDGLYDVSMDPTQVDQILTNLCVNARDAIGGVGTIEIKTSNVTSQEALQIEGLIEDSYVKLSVRDTGCGIPPEQMPLIFEPFYTTKDTSKGTGLGLATVYGILEQNKGKVQVFSEPGRGTRFDLYFPRTLQRPPQGVERVLDLPMGSGEAILLVEDSEFLLESLAAIFDSLNYRVHCSYGPEEALHLCDDEQIHIDILITDLVMPGLNGRELADRLQKDRPGMHVLFMSGYTPDVIAKRGYVHQGEHFIQKPFDAIDLARKVRLVLNQ
jgi:PAS domain S-box-containing protein